MDKPRTPQATRAGLIAIAALALLFGVGPVVLHLLRPIPEFTPAERVAIDADWERLAEWSAETAAPPGAAPIEAAAAEAGLRELARRMERVSGIPSTPALSLRILRTAGYFSVNTLEPTPELELALDALLAWHRGELEAVDPAVADDRVPELLHRLARAAVEARGDDAECLRAVAHLARALWREDDLTRGELALGIAGLVRDELPENERAELPGEGDLVPLLLGAALRIDGELGELLADPASHPELRARALGDQRGSAAREEALLRYRRAQLRRRIAAALLPHRGAPDPGPGLETALLGLDQELAEPNPRS